jgi:FtsH-binding integral membrane protein
MNFSFKPALPLFITFLVLTVLSFAGNLFLAAKGINYGVVMGGNCLFLLISLFVFRLQYLAMYNSNPQVFIRSVMGGMLIKVVGCVIAVIAYYFISGSAFNKPAVYISMVIYIVYLVVEVRTIMKLNKTKNA